MVGVDPVLRLEQPAVLDPDRTGRLGDGDADPARLGSVVSTAVATAPPMPVMAAAVTATSVARTGRESVR